MLKKRILSLFVTLTMVAGLLAAFPVYAYEKLTGSAGSNGLRWRFEPDTNTLYIEDYYGAGGKMDNNKV